jgi:hypothetical protein
MTTPDAAAAYVADIARTFKSYKALGEAALAQVPTEADLHRQLDPDSNSVAVIVKHVSGNLRSRFSDFLTTDGEKPDRDRDGEFEMPQQASREEVMRWWESGWSAVLGAVESLAPEDLMRTIYIRGEAFLVVEALNRSVTHTAYHVGEIVYLARHLASPNWKSLSIPKGKSAEFAKGNYKTTGPLRR